MENMSEIARDIVDYLKYPCKVFAAKTPYDEIMKAYQEAFERGRKEGFTPVLIPVDDTLEDYFEMLEADGYSAEAALAAESRTGKEILDQRFKEYTAQNTEEFEMNMDEFIGEYDDEPEVITQYTSLFHYSTGETLETLLIELPTAKPWEAVAYVPFGGWNECPPPGEMAAICKYWYEAHGAIPVIITSDTLEMSVPAPIGNEKALEAAKEHYAFTPDRVDQGTATGTLSEVAACIAVSDIWFFWWD